MTVTQYRIYRGDTIPNRVLKARTVLHRLKEHFEFTNVGILPPSDEIVAEGGAFTVSDGRLVVVERLLVSDRRTVLVVLGASSAANEVSNELMAFIGGAVPDAPVETAVPIVFRQETSCIVTLDFPASALLARPMNEFLSKELMAAASDSDADAVLKTVKLRIEIGYHVQRKEIESHGITFAPKAFVIEPRVDRPLSDRRYYTESPTDSDTHMRLVAMLENSLAMSGSG